jgi:TonB family C-terminal domain
MSSICLGLAMPTYASPRTSPETAPKSSDSSLDKDVDYGPFMRELQVKIKRAWYPPKSNESRKALVVFKVQRNGRVSKVRIAQSTGIAKGDQAAIKAVESVSYKLKLPPKAPESVDIQFTFDYNVFRGTGKDASQKTLSANSKHCCNGFGCKRFSLIAVPLFIALFVGLINALRYFQRKRAPIWLIGSALLGIFAAIGFLWPFLNSVN